MSASHSLTSLEHGVFFTYSPDQSIEYQDRDEAYNRLIECRCGGKTDISVFHQCTEHIGVNGIGNPVQKSLVARHLIEQTEV